MLIVDRGFGHDGLVAMVDGVEVRFTNLGKVVYPATGTTKADIVDYYVAVAPLLLPGLAGRPLTRKRWPGGVAEPSRNGLCPAGVSSRSCGPLPDTSSTAVNGPGPAEAEGFGRCLPEHQRPASAPSSIAPVIFAISSGSYGVLYAVAGVCAVIGAVAILPVKRVR